MAVRQKGVEHKHGGILQKGAVHKVADYAKRGGTRKWGALNNIVNSSERGGTEVVNYKKGVEHESADYKYYNVAESGWNTIIVAAQEGVECPSVRLHGTQKGQRSGHMKEQQMNFFCQLLTNSCSLCML